jgi:hypothetical protein
MDTMFEKIFYWVFYGIFYAFGRILRFIFDVTVALITLGLVKRAKRKLSEPHLLTLPKETRFEHTHILGGSGHGKTQLIQSMFKTQDLQNLTEGRSSVIMIDSQGDLIRNISRLSQLTSFSDRVILIDPTDIEHPPCLNLFDFGLKRVRQYDPVERERILNGAVDLYQYMFSELLGAEMTNRQSVVFGYIAELLMVVPDATLYTLLDFMEDPQTVVPHLSKLDPASQRFFTTQFLTHSFDATRQQIAARLWGIFRKKSLYRMFSHTQNKLDMFAAMNRGSLILINTAKEFLKEDCRLFGRFLIALVAQATQERSTVPEERRLPTFVYIDEAHDYFDTRLEDFLNTARKYKVGLILAHQNLGQLDQGLRGSIMASTAIKFAGGVSPEDAKKLAPAFHCGPEFIGSMQKMPGDARFAAYVKGVFSQAVEFSVPLGSMDRLPKMSEEEYQRLRSDNRERYCAPYDGRLLASSQAFQNAGVTFDLDEQRTL